MTDSKPVEFVAVPISLVDRAFGLKFHLVRRGVKVERARRCKICFRLLARNDIKLCQTCKTDWKKN